MWENLGGGPLFSCFIAFLKSNFVKSFEGVKEVLPSSLPSPPLSPLSPLPLCASVISRNYLLNRSDEKGSSFHGRSQFSLNSLQLQIVEGGEGHCVDPVNVVKLVGVFRRRRVVLKRRNFHQTFSGRIYPSSWRRKMLPIYEMSNSLRLTQKS